MICKSYIYILSNINNTTLYIGVTSDLEKRLIQHREGSLEGFTSQYNCKKLVYFEEHPDIRSAILREKQLKKWKREWKEKLIDTINPERNELML